jgi:hypothetical protein
MQGFHSGANLRLDIELESVRLADVAGGVRRTPEGLACSGDHELTIDLPKDLLPVRADPARLPEIC